VLRLSRLLPILLPMGFLSAQGPLPPITIRPASEQLALLASAAPAAVTRDATLLLHDASGLRVHRSGRNGYSCFIEYYEQVAVEWPVCYEPEMAAVVVPVNQLLEQFRRAGRSAEDFRRSRDSLEATLPTPQPGGISYRLSPSMVTIVGEARRPGIWMFLITAPYPKIARLGLDRSVSDGRGGSVGIGTAGRGKSGYYYLNTTPLPGQLAGLAAEPGP
jgi:hypothetical protein